jgi:hypothetical protein
LSCRVRCCLSRLMRRASLPGAPTTLAWAPAPAQASPLHPPTHPPKQATKQPARATHAGALPHHTHAARSYSCSSCPPCAGIHYSDDKLLQTRIFSYQDTQRHRLGGNYLLLPPNAPKCAHHNNHHDGAMNFLTRTEEVNYFPSRSDPTRGAARTPVPPRPLAGRRERAVIPKVRGQSGAASLG